MDTQAAQQEARSEPLFTAGPDQECWVQDRIRDAINMAMALHEHKGVRANEFALRYGVQGIVEGSAIEIIRTLGGQPEFVNLRDPFLGVPDGISSKAFHGGDPLRSHQHHLGSSPIQPTNGVPDMTTHSVLEEVGAERGRQDDKWGGAVHDDNHSFASFVRWIGNYTGWSHQMADGHDWVGARRRMIQVAALAVASVEKIDRQHPVDNKP